ncbi:MAG: rhomboid family intramembrane serine protease [Prevotellaceae bacterium]|jgi:membrane associated rhomboid family serine protease|nr:rhomboid family intramembrane serine protease [Prevotellaceae bacterium]
MQKRIDSAIKALIILLLVSCYLLFDSLYTNPMIYMFFHKNIFHLLGNCFWLLFIPNLKRNILPAYVIAVSASILTPEYTVGFSGVLMALVGINLSDNRFIGRKCSRFLLVLSAVTFGLSFLLPNVASFVHAFSIVLGYLYSIIRRIFNDYRAAYTGK